jgi:hypothetical protein
VNEASLLAGLRDELKRRHFTVFKHTDRIVKGIPDTSASRNHKTVWLEAKFTRVAEWPTEFDWSKFLGMEDMVQLANMVRLERDAIAFYILFAGWGVRHQAYVVFPSQVLHSVKMKIPVALGSPTTLEQIGEWL